MNDDPSWYGGDLEQLVCLGNLAVRLDRVRDIAEVTGSSPVPPPPSCTIGGTMRVSCDEELAESGIL